MKRCAQGVLWLTIAAGLCRFVWAGQPVFILTPNVKGPVELTAGQNGTAIYQVFNNSGRSLNGIGLVNLPAGVSLIPDAGDQYCSSTFNLSAGASCLIKIQMNKSISGSINGGPKVCYAANNPIYCSQPLTVDQLSTQVVSTSLPTACDENISNFNFELSQQIDANPIDPDWGPARNHLLLSPANPNLTVCTTTNIADTAAISWMQSRLIAAENFWVNQKLNYCHHHVADWQTPATVNGVPRAEIASGGGYCNPALDIMPGSYYYNQQARWNYSGSGSETIDNWLNKNLMWYGVDCSDFTSFVYNFAFGIRFNSDTGYQSGQATDGSQDNLFPNAQTLSDQLGSFNNADPNSPAGVLVCKDGRTEHEYPRCGGFGTNGYFSAFLHPNAHPDHPEPTPSNITDEMLNNLKPGDLIFLGFAGGSGNNPRSMVTHVITWTGKRVGYGENDVNPTLIAPEPVCPQSDWQPQVGDWVIIDSTYQGPDYRVFTKCFYQNNIWGVRRVIGYMS